MDLTPPRTQEAGDVRKHANGKKKDQEKTDEDELLIMDVVTKSAEKMSIATTGTTSTVSHDPTRRVTSMTMMTASGSPARSTSSPKQQEETLYDELLLSTPVNQQHHRRNGSQGSWAMMSPNNSFSQLYNHKGVFMAEITTPVTRNTTDMNAHVSTSHTHANDSHHSTVKSMWISPDDKNSKDSSDKAFLSLPIASTTGTENGRMTLTSASLVAAANDDNRAAASSSNNSFAPVPTLRHRSHSFQLRTASNSDINTTYVSTNSDSDYKLKPLNRRDNHHLPNLIMMDNIHDDTDDAAPNNQHSTSLNDYRHTIHNHLILPETPPRSTTDDTAAQTHDTPDTVTDSNNSNNNNNNNQPSSLLPLRDGPVLQRHHSFTGPSQFRNLHPNLLQQMQQLDEQQQQLQQGNPNHHPCNHNYDDKQETAYLIRYDQQYQPTRNQDYSIGVEPNSQLDSIFKKSHSSHTGTTATKTTDCDDDEYDDDDDDFPFPTPERQWTIHMANHVQPTFDDNSTVTYNSESKSLSSSYHSLNSLELLPEESEQVIITYGMDHLKQNQNNNNSNLENTAPGNTNTNANNRTTIISKSKRRRQQREQKAYEWLRHMKLQSNLNQMDDDDDDLNDVPGSTKHTNNLSQQPCLQEAASSRFLTSGPSLTTTTINNKNKTLPVVQPSNIFYPRTTSANM